MDYKQKYLKYKRKYIKLKGSSIRNGNEGVDMNIIIQNVLNINEAELEIRRDILRNANPGGPDPLNRPDKPADPRQGPVLRAWAIGIREHDEHVSDERKTFLLNNYYLANWGDHPPSWWPFNR